MSLFFVQYLMSLPLLRHGATAFIARKRLYHSFFRTQGDAYTRHLNSFAPAQTSDGLSLTAAEERLPYRIVNDPPDMSTGSKSSEAFVLDALQRRKDPKLVMKAFIQASENPQYLQSLPQSTFERILELLAPEHHIKPFTEFRDDWSLIKELWPRVERLVIDYTNIVDLLMTRWREAGRPFRLAEYRFMMKIACELRSQEMAENVRLDMEASEVEMDTTCYNYLIETKCWNEALDVKEWHHHRFIRYFTQARKYIYRTGGGGIPLNGYKSYTVHGRKSIQVVVSRHFSEMVEKGLVADVNTFRILLLAQGRAGQVAAVKSILRKAWDVDLDSVRVEKDGAHTSQLSPDSPIYPTPLLLETIAHVFGYNNDLATAMRAVDYMSRKFTIEITRQTWFELLRWAYILSQQTPRGKVRRKTYRRGKFHRGKVLIRAPLDLWSAMLSPPYSIQPSLRMYRYLIRRLLELGSFTPIIEALREACRLAANPSLATEQLWSGNALAVSDASLRTSEHLSHPLLSRQYHRLELKSLSHHRDRQIIDQLIWKLGYCKEISDPRVSQGGSEMVQEFWKFKPRRGFILAVGSGLMCIFREQYSEFRVNPSRRSDLLVVRGTTLPKLSQYKAETQDFINLQANMKENDLGQEAEDFLIEKELHNHDNPG